jgi:hypothetical protein
VYLVMVRVFARREDMVKQLELELQHERSLAETMVSDMVLTWNFLLVIIDYRKTKMSVQVNLTRAR